MSKKTFDITWGNDGFSFDLAANTDSELETVAGLFKQCFGIEEEGLVYLYRKNDELVSNCEGLDHYFNGDSKKLRIPQIKAIVARFKSLQNGTIIAFRCNCLLEQVAALDLNAFLNWQNGGENPESFSDYLKKYACEILNNYTLYASPRDESQHKIGNKDLDRACRYCGRSKPDVTFQRVAHAFSEGLGNKTIVTADECDVCNDIFGRTIEQDFIHYVDPMRAFLKVNGKNGPVTHIDGEKL